MFNISKYVSTGQVSIDNRYSRSRYLDSKLDKKVHSEGKIRPYDWTESVQLLIQKKVMFYFLHITSQLKIVKYLRKYLVW